jgi:hypothetical protein
MNALYNWTNDEIMIEDQKKNIEHEANEIRLLREAGLLEPSPYKRITAALGKSLTKLGQHLQRKHTHSHRTPEIVTH